MWDGLAIPTEQVQRILRETNGAFIEVDIYRQSSYLPRLDADTETFINCMYHLYEPVAPFTMKVNPVTVVGIHHIPYSVIRDTEDEEQSQQVG